ncbi:hypothetical protein BST61_g9380 [Cercospora zeina]
MGLKRPSNGVQTRANRLSGVRNDLKQRALPGAARPDPCEIPTSAEKPPRLRRPIDDLRDFSPIRKQKAARPVEAEETTEVSNDSQNATNSTGPSAQTATDSTSRPASRRPATVNMQPAEPSSGSARRQASPRRKPNAEGRDGSAHSIGLAESVEAVTEDQVEDPSADTNAAPSRKRGRPRKGDTSDRPSKFPKQTKAPHNSSLSLRRRSGRINAGSSGSTAAAQGSPRIQPVSIHASELEFPTPQQHPEPEPKDSSEIEKEVPTAATKQPKQLKRTLKPKKAKAAAVQQHENFARNRRNNEFAEEQFANENEVLGEIEGETSVVEEEADVRLLGHHEILKAAVKQARKAEKGAQGEEVDKEIKKMQHYCLKFIKALNEHRDRPQDVELLSNPPEEFQTIAADIRTLCGRDLSRPVDRKDLTKSHNIYLRLMPALVRVLYALVECYQAVDLHTAPPERSVTIEHLQTITTFTSMFLELNTGAKQFIRPDPNLKIVQPFDREIVPRLKTMLLTFHRHIQEHEQLQISRAQNRRLQRRREAQERARATERAEKARWNLVETKWTNLHTERSRADETFTTLAKRQHLRQPVPAPEEDHNGATFERLEIFRPRVGPLPAMVEKAKTQAWPEKSYEALMQGLEMWSGDILVFERIFRKFCGRKQPLNGYNVTEIVVMAALVKRHLEETWDVDGEREWWWVRQIPDWTRPHTVLEQLEAAAADVDGVA